MQQTALEERRQNGPHGGECEDDATNGSRGEEAEPETDTKHLTEDSRTRVGKKGGSA